MSLPYLKLRVGRNTVLGRNSWRFSFPASGQDASLLPAPKREQWGIWKETRSQSRTKPAMLLSPWGLALNMPPLEPGGQ